jgi:predicted RNA-binding protein YlqC (UPF0109 family)
MDAPEALREFLSYVVANLIDHPREATIASGRNATGGLVFRVMLAPEDVGPVQGRNGIKISLKIGSVRDDGGAGATYGAQDRADEGVTRES